MNNRRFVTASLQQNFSHNTDTRPEIGCFSLSTFRINSTNPNSSRKFNQSSRNSVTNSTEGSTR